MTSTDTIVALAAAILAGDPLAVGRGATVVERGAPAAEELLALVHARALGAERIGVTGPPGAGKSSLSGQLAQSWRQRGQRVGLVAVDPSSPFTGGAVLGDRVRLPRELMVDREVFFRSLATRGALGGLAASAHGVVDLLAAWGAARVLIETVGVGQSEVDIAAAADTTLLVLQPQTGDAVQALKAGILEIADIVVVHKADLPGADQLMREVESALALRRIQPGAREVLVVAASSTGAPGVSCLLDAIDEQARWLDEPRSGRATRRQELRTHQLAARIRQLASTLLTAPLSTPALVARLDELAKRAAAGTLAPAAAARELLTSVRE